MAPLPVEPATISRLRTSSTDFTPAVCHTAMVSTTGAMVPSQWNLVVSNFTPLPPTACSDGQRVAHHADKGAVAWRDRGYR